MKQVRVSRREFLKTSAGAAATVGLMGCSEFTGSSGTGRTRHSFRLGLDTYTVHRSLTAQDESNRVSLWRLIDRLDELGLTGLQIDPSHFKCLPGDDPKALDRLEEVHHEKGYYFEIGMGGWDPDRMVERIRMTARFGGKALRTFCGHEGTTQEELRNYIQWSAPAFRQAAEATEDCDVRIAVENHGDFTSDQMLELIELADHPRVGVCLDTGNSLFRKEDPIRCAKNLAKYTYSMHIKDWFMTFDEKGHPQWEPAVVGKGEVPVADILRIVAGHHRDLYLAIENPIQPLDTEAATVKREWQHLVASAKATNELLSSL